MESENKTTLKKGREVKVETKKGGSYSYRYTELSDINEYIDSIGEKYYQTINKIEGDDYIFTKRIGDNAPQELLQGCKILTAPLETVSNPAQEQGSALTYARRYSLLMAYGLATEDDDANSLNRTVETKVTTKESAENYIITFGQYKGETLKTILEKDDEYLDWLLNGEKTKQELKDAILLLKSNEPQTTFEKQMDADEEMINEGQKQYIQSNINGTSLESTLKKLKVNNINALTWVQANDISKAIKKKLEETNKNDEEAF